MIAFHVTAGHTGAGASSLNPVFDRPPLDITEAVYPQYYRQLDRQATFTSWPLTQHFHPDTLVPLGFYYAGYADCIRCFYCGVGLKSWAANDDVMLEHIRWRPDCGFLLNTRGRRFVQGVASSLRNEEDHSPESTSSANNRAGEGGGGPSSRGQETRRTTAEMRRNMADMGFSDSAVTLAVQHLEQTGATAIDEDAVVEAILELQSREGTTVSDRADNSEHTAQAGFHTEAAGGDEDARRTAERAQLLQVENERLRAARTCRLCHTETVGLTFLPCRHLLTCARCGAHLTQCPGCGQRITSAVKVYYS